VTDETDGAPCQFCDEQSAGLFVEIVNGKKVAYAVCETHGRYLDARRRRAEMRALDGKEQT
jgi:protein-arginine kinase activator protein McsA